LVGFPKKPWLVILNDSEESRVLIGQIINENCHHFFTSFRALAVGILPRPKARSE